MVSQKTLKAILIPAIIIIVLLSIKCGKKEDIHPILVESVLINEGNISLEEGASVNLTVTTLPQNADNKNVNWQSSNANTAVVEPNGRLTAVNAGTAVITAAAADDSGAQDSVTVTVTAPEKPAVPMTPQEIFASLKGQNVTTNGWADQANSGAGLSYANPATLTLIDDASYPDTKAKREAFTDAVNSDNEKFIIVSGDIDLGDGVISDADKSYFDAFDPATHKRLHGDIRFNIRSNTTIIGINNARLMFGGLNINNRSNIIIRNITFYDAHGSTEEDTKFNVDSKASIDALTVQGNSDGVWVDHCKFTDGTCNDMIRNYNHDGAFDIPKGKNITVSWCEFTNHDKVMLVAGSDSAENAVAADRQITLHHNYFHGTTQRMPRTRGTQMHVYNNYYNDIGIAGNTGSFMGPGWGAEFIVENNYFCDKPGKTIEWFDTNPSVYPVKFYYNDNNRVNSDTAWWGRPSDPKPWTPAYSYSPQPCNGLPSSIPNGAGASLKFKK
jgi:pectate lyase